MRTKLYHLPTKLFIILSFCLAMSACIPRLPNDTYQKNKVQIPKNYPDFARNHVDQAKKSDSSSLPWQQFFVDKQLKNLINQAIHHNQEINIATQEVQITRNEILARQGEYLPKAWLSAGYEIEKVGEFTSQGASDATTEYEPGKFVPTVLHNHQIGLVSSWEVDIWKKLRRATKSSFYRYLASREMRRWLVTKLVAEIANTYYELKALDRQLIIVQKFVKSLQEAQKVVKIQKSAARTTSLAVKRYEAEVLKNQSRLYKIKQAIILHENKLNLLVGRFPQKIKRSDKSLDQLIPKKFSTGVPLRLLENRPDIRQVCLELEASKLDVSVARAQFLPSLAIDAGIGYEAFKGNLWFITPESVFYQLAARLTAPLINRNTIKAAYLSANNRQIQALYHYDLKMLTAFKEVVDQLAKLENTNKIHQLRSKQVEALSKSVQISNMLFQAVRVDYLESLLAQRDLLDAQVELVEVKKQRLSAYVNLYKALGGGWRQA